MTFVYIYEIGPFPSGKPCDGCGEREGVHVYGGGVSPKRWLCGICHWRNNLQRLLHGAEEAARLLPIAREKLAEAEREAAQ